MNGLHPLEIRGLSFSYGNAAVLDNANLHVQPGEMLGLVGPNGAGKTTLLRCITGTLRPVRGGAYLDGDDVQGLSPKNRAKRVAMVPQNPAVPPGFTALDVVLMGRNPHLGLLQWEGQADLAVARRVMELTDTWRFANRLISTLSGGEKQGVFIARSLAQEPPVLLLDEPTAHLDIRYQPVVLDLIQEIRSTTGVTVLAAMHDLSLAAQYCERIAVLHKGAIYALGEPEEVITKEVVSEVFNTQVSIGRHPVYGTPVVLPVGKRAVPTMNSPRNGSR